MYLGLININLNDFMVSEPKQRINTLVTADINYIPHVCNNVCVTDGTINGFGA